MQQDRRLGIDHPDVMFDSGAGDATFSIACPECEFNQTAGSASEAVEWIEKHRFHTGHVCECTPPETLADDADEYLVQCRVCGFDRRPERVTYAHAFATDHTLVTDHPRPRIETQPIDTKSRRAEIYERKDELFRARIKDNPERRDEIRELNEELEQLMRGSSSD
jgi:hypothetical protein